MLTKGSYKYKNQLNSDTNNISIIYIIIYNDSVDTVCVLLCIIKYTSITYVKCLVYYSSYYRSNDF